MNSIKLFKCVSCLVLLFSFVFVGCSKVDSNNISAIEYVVTNLFTCPDETLNDYFDKASEEVPSKVEMGVYNLTDTVNGKKLVGYLEEKYAKYFEDSEFDKFTSFYVIKYSVTSQLSGYKIKVVDVSIKREENTVGTDYLFEAELRYTTNDNTEKTTKVKGTARCKNEGKISYINVDASDTLLREMLDKINSN